MIAGAVPRSMIDGGYHSACFFWFQVSRRPSQCLLIANRQYAPILARSGNILPQQMLHKAAKGRQTAISRNGGVSTSRFDVIQETEHGVGLNIFKSQVGQGLRF